VDPTGNRDPVDDGDQSDVGEPFDDNEPEPMDYDDAEPEPNVEDDDDDDADLERQAMADENAEGDDPEEGTSMETSSAKAKRGTKRPATATPIKKVRRKSQLPVEGDNQYQGDFVTRRSGRVHMKPLDWWRGERKEWQKGANGPDVKSVTRVPREVVKPRPAPKKKHGAGRGRSQSAAAPPEPPAVAPGMELLDFDHDIDTMANVKDYVTGEIITRSRCKVQCPADPQKRSCHII
jgi:centromere protein C